MEVAALAPGGTTVRVPVVVATEPVTCNFCEFADTNGPAKPTLSGSRVSRMRAGSIVTTDDGALDAALATNKPPPPKVTATAAPIAAQRERHNARRRVETADDAISTSHGFVDAPK
jgi:hypothetical protein